MRNELSVGVSLHIENQLALCQFDEQGIDRTANATEAVDDAGEEHSTTGVIGILARRGELVRESLEVEERRGKIASREAGSRGVRHALARRLERGLGGLEAIARVEEDRRGVLVIGEQ